MEVRHIENHVDIFTHGHTRAGVHPGSKVVLAIYQVKEDLITHQLGHIHLCIDIFSNDGRWGILRSMNIFRTNTEDDILPNQAFKDILTLFGDLLT